MADLLAYAVQVHRRVWCVTLLPAELGARRFDREVAPSLLGVSMQKGGRRAIGINDRIKGTPLEVPVIAHECAHLLLGHDEGFCLPAAPSSRQEHDAWLGAALLAAPIAEAADEAWLPRALDVPRELLAMRHALMHFRSAEESYGRLREWIRTMAAMLKLPHG